jgi:3-oxoacyl-[acyl-carrier protein] reductase
MRTAIVTGGTSGIGLAVAEALLRRGHRAFICGRDAGRLECALAQLQQNGTAAVAGQTCDVRSLSSVESMAAEACRKFGRIDALVNCAGIGYTTPFEELAPEEWRDTIDTNLGGVYHCCRAIVPLLKAAGGGDVVNLGSRSGRYAFRGGVAYNTTKFGLQGFSEALFLDLQPSSIRVSLVAPGTVATGFGGTPVEPWHLQPIDVAQVIVQIIEADPGASLNWVELRPARPSLR